MEFIKEKKKIYSHNSARAIERQRRFAQEFSQACSPCEKMNVMRVTRYTLHAYEIYTRWHTPGIHVRGRSGSLLPPWVASLGSQDRDRPACCSAMHANDRYVALHRSCASPRANTGRFKNISFFPFFPFFDSAHPPSRRHSLFLY